MELTARQEEIKAIGLRCDDNVLSCERSEFIRNSDRIFREFKFWVHARFCMWYQTGRFCTKKNKYLAKHARFLLA